MMLSRVAENLFWIGRYMERAENVARLVDVARRMSVLPREVGRPLSNEWSSILIAAGSRAHFGEDIDRIQMDTAVDHLVFDGENPSSVLSCIKAARENARSIRFAMTRDCWEALNSGWSEMKTKTPADVRGSGLSDFIDWVIALSAQFRGAVFGTMTRDDTFYFVRLGMTVERVDSTARLLDVKYHVLLPSSGDVGSSADHYQWLSLLQAAAAHRAYTAMREDDVSAQGVAEFLILEPNYPRSILHNVAKLRDVVEDIEAHYDFETPCHAEVESFTAHLRSATVDGIINQGLHEFLTDIIDRNYRVANRLSEAYGFLPVLREDTDGETGQ